jgi:hypothetical protein
MRRLGVPILLSIGTGALFCAWFRAQALDEPFRAYGNDVVNRQPAGEGGFFLGFAVFGTLAAVAAAVACRRAAGDWLARALERMAARPRRSVLALAALATLCAAAIGVAFWHQNFTDDEYAYLFTAKLLRHGHISAPLRRFFQPSNYQFIVTANGRQFAIYGVLHAALLLPGLLLGLPQLVPHLCAGVVVLACAGIAFELCSVRAAVVAALAAATSPFLLLTCATMHNASTSTACCALFLWAGVRFERHLQLRDAVLAGIALGAAIHIRILDALCYGGPFALYALARLATGPARARRSCGYAALGACALFGLALYLAANAHLTGDWRRTPYDVFNQRWPNGRMFGFGRGAMPAFTNPPQVAWSRLVVQVTRGSLWMFGWPVGLLPALAASPRRVASALVAFPVAVVSGYFLYFANSVHDTGPVYYLCALPALAALVAAGWEAIGAALSRSLQAAALAGLVASNLVLFLPRELGFARAVARSIRRPKLAAARAGLHHAIVMAHSMYVRTSIQSWVFYPPIPGEHLEDDDVVWLGELGARTPELQATYPGWGIYRLRWRGAEPVIEPVAGTP